MNHLQLNWNRLLSIGASDKVSKEEEKYVRFTNVIALVSIMAVAFYIPLSLWKGHLVLSVLQTLDVLCLFGVLALNHYQHHKFARQTYLLVINVFILANSCFIGYGGGTHDFLYITYILPFLLFSARDYKNIVVGVLFAVASFALFQQIHSLFSAYTFDPATQHTFFQINMWMKFVLLGIAIYILAYYNYSSEAEVADTNKKLEAQVIELKRSNEELEQFAYVISHDLKGPVRNISSFMNLLMSRCAATLADDAKVFMQHSQDSADRLASQIDGLLSYCRVDRNLPPTSDVDLNAVMKTVVVELNEKVKEKNATLIVEENLPVLHGIHAGLMHTVFKNLVSNAIKFNHAAQPEIIVGHKEENGILIFSITDNGIGIDSKFSSKLFQMFKRLHAPEQYEGTGIGLALCKKIITFYKGSIWFESEPEKGSTFFFTLDKTFKQNEAVPSIEVRPMMQVLKAA